MVNLVIGGSGFIGSHLVAALHARGEQVRIFDARPPRDREGVDFVQGSVTDPAGLKAAMQDAAYVFHMAANAHLWAPDKSVFNAINYQGTKNVLDVFRESPASKLVHTSSLTVLVAKKFSRSLRMVDETLHTDEADMLGPYPLSKWRAEKAVLAASGDGGETVALLPTMPVGPGDCGLTGPTRMILDYVNGKVPAILNARMNLIDARDVADAHIAARDQGRPGERYILGGENIWMTDLVKMIGELSGRRMPTSTVPYVLARAFAWLDEAIADITKKPPTAPLTGVRIAGRVVDFSNKKACRELALKPRPLDRSLAEQIAWFERIGWLSPV